jgi:twitching motility protein PilT
VLRILGDLSKLNEITLSSEDIDDILQGLLNKEQLQKFNIDKGADIAYSIEGLSRFRVHIFKQRGMTTIVVRAIPFKIPTLDELGLPQVCKELCRKPKGLIIVTGAAGAGKTTTQASMIDYINSNFPVHIVTIEDPIEYVHKNKKGLINQRCLGVDTLSFNEALRHVFRQDPDVILIGEMRDLETIQLAITAAETGHLVITTLHTTNSIQSLERIIDVFPPYQQNQIRMQLTANLIGIISQTLVKRQDNKGRIAAFEVLINIPAVRYLIRENKTYQINSILQTHRKYGMVALDQSLAELHRKDIITYEEGLSHAINPSDFRRLVSE